MFVIFVNWIVNKKCVVEFKIIKLKLKNKCQQDKFFFLTLNRSHSVNIGLRVKVVII
jgi:hypothetical protein